MQSGHGMASHASRLVHALATSRLAPRLKIAVPESGLKCVPDGLQAMPLSCPSCSPPLISEALWQNRLGAHVMRHHAGDVLLALSPFYSWYWPERTVVVWHDLIPFRCRRYMGRFLYRRWLFQARLRRVRRTSVVIADSRHTASELCFFLQAKLPPVKTIHLWDDRESSGKVPYERVEAIRQKYGLPSRYWLYVGGYDYRKNVEFLIQAYALAKGKYSCPSLVLAGKIPVDLGKPVCDISGAILKNRLGSGDICLPGFIEQVDMGALYSGAELFIYPSLSEGFGFPPLEAMGCGCPAIVADSTSLPEVVVDPEYRFSPHDAGALAQLLGTAASKPLVINPGFDRDYFSEQRGVNEYCDVLEGVAV